MYVYVACVPECCGSVCCASHIFLNFTLSFVILSASFKYELSATPGKQNFFQVAEELEKNLFGARHI
jgi:hypothetical protein